MRKWLTFFIWFSLAFLAYRLYQGKYLSIPTIYSWPTFIISVILLGVANCVNAINWQKMLRYIHVSATFEAAYASIGISIFGKYIPGFVWTVLGRVGFIAERYKVSKSTLASLSLQSQIITLWVGLLLGMAGLLLSGNFGYWGWIALFGFLAFTFIIYTSFFNHLLEGTLQYVFKKDFYIPRLSFVDNVAVMPWFFSNWLIWCLGFYFLEVSLYPGNIPYSTSLGFAFAATIGILAIFTPGGVGVREGMLVLFLTQCSIPLKEAVTISVASRFWFLIGELIFFVSSAFIVYFKRATPVS